MISRVEFDGVVRSTGMILWFKDARMHELGEFDVIGLGACDVTNTGIDVLTGSGGAAVTFILVH